MEKEPKPPKKESKKGGKPGPKIGVSKSSYSATRTAKSVMFRDDILERLQGLERTWNASFSRVVEVLIERALVQTNLGPEESENFCYQDLPEPLRNTVKHICQLTGKSAHSVLVDIWSDNIKAYLVRAQTQAEDIHQIISGSHLSSGDSS